MLEELTEPDEQISADNMEALSLKLLSELPMEGVEGSPLDADVIWKTEGYYPGNRVHEINLSDILPELRQSATIQAQAQLASHRLMINSVDFEVATLHVVTADWLLERLPGMWTNTDE